MKREQYAEAFQRGFSGTLQFLLARGAHVEDAQELAQAAWTRGWEHLDQLRQASSVGPWINSIALNLFRAQFRVRPTMPIDGVDAHYTMNLREIDLHRLLERCSPRDRALLEKSLEGCSTQELAENLGITSTGVRVRMLRLRRLLRGMTSVSAT